LTHIDREIAQPHILYFSLSRLDVGGVETHLLQLLAGLKGYRLSVAGVLSERFQHAVEQQGVEVYPLPPAHKYDPFAIWRYTSLFRQLEVDIVHTHDTRGGLLGRIAGKLAKCRIVHTVHTPSFFLTQNAFIKRLYQHVEGLLNDVFTDKVVFVARPIQALYQSLHVVPESKSCYIPNGIDHALVEQDFNGVGQRGECGVPLNAMVVLYVGRLSYEKGLNDLLPAFDQVAAQYHNAYLVLLGDGQERSSLQDLADTFLFVDRIKFCGFQAHIKVARWLLNADVFVLPSYFESMPYTLLEAMTAGLPCIASRVGGNVDLVQDGETGLLVDPGDVEGLTQALRRLLTDADLRERLGQQARAKVQEFSVEKMVTRTAQVYREVLGDS